MVGGSRPRLRPSTRQGYQSKMRKHIRPALGHRRASDIHAGVIAAFYGRLASNGLSDSSILKVHNVLRKAFSDAVRWQLVAANPCDRVDTPRVVQQEPDVWNEEQVEVFIEGIVGNEWEAIWKLAAVTGMRRGELAGLRWQHVDLERRVVRVVRTRTVGDEGPVEGEPKTKAGRRPMLIDPEAAELLADLHLRQLETLVALGVAIRPEWVVAHPDGSPVHPGMLSKRFRRLCDSLDIPYIRLHDIRHTAATVQLDNGVPLPAVTQRLGHSSTSFTYNRYIHWMGAQDEAAAEVMGRVTTRKGARATSGQHPGNISPLRRPADESGDF